MNKKEAIPGFIASSVPDDATDIALKEFAPYVRQSGNQMRPHWHLGPRWLLDYLLVFIGSGEGVFTVGGDIFHVGADDAVLIPPDTLHEMSGTSAKMHCIYLHFDLIYDSERSLWNACIPAGADHLSDFSEFMHPPLKDSFWSCLFGKLPLSNPAAVKTLMTRICALHDNCSSENTLRLSGLMLELLAELKDQLLDDCRKSVPGYEKLWNAGKYITDNPDICINVKALAKKSGLSESHFRRLFKQVHGVAPKTMQMQARIRKACEMLAYWNMNVSEVSEQLKFSSIYSFSRAFKSVTGVAPTQYLKSKQGL